jgi:hypothetical protein
LVSGRAALWTRENMAWLAGLLEGEGAFYMRRAKNRSPRFCISLQMTDRDVVERALEVAGIGSRVTTYERSAQGVGRLGCVEKDIHVWRVQAEGDAIALALALYPWLGERRRTTIKQSLRESYLHPRRRYRSAPRASSGEHLRAA